MRTLDLCTLINRLFPSGTQSWVANEGKSPAPISGRPTWPSVPDFPPDLFAAVGLLLETAGAYSYFVPDEGLSSLATSSTFCIEPGDRDDAVAAGRAWQNAVTVPSFVQNLWAALGVYHETRVYVEHHAGMSAASWWGIALRLLIAADEACADVGYGTTREKGSRSPEPSWIYHWVQAAFYNIFNDLVAQDEARRGSGHIKFFPQSSTICNLVDPDVVCVQPKSRTPTVGCALRTLSHNLALLPPRGTVRTVWQRPFDPPPEDETVLNLLLIPFPFEVSAAWFKADVVLSPSQEEGSHRAHVAPWGWFQLRQEWLLGPASADAAAAEREVRSRRQALLGLVKALLVQARKDVGTVHGVVFPEYALDWQTYEVLLEDLRTHSPDVQFMVAGSSNNCKNETGNFVLATVFSAAQGQERSQAISTSRAKHHRWKLEASQVATYALASALDPRLMWWEKTILPKREIHIHVFRDSSTFATMICEDLARSDPCHVVLRATAPSLVIVLLMDGPQVTGRWASRYATVLAEDPGSSVLTFTSIGLLQRSNRTRQFDQSRCVALWKDDTGTAVQISLEPQAHGICLTLSGHRTAEITLDGRQNRDGRAWRFHGQQPVRIDDTLRNKPEWSGILGDTR